jgi:hypothetical protein
MLQHYFERRVAEGKTAGQILEQFHFTYCHCISVQGGFFLRKKPLDCPVFVKT